jgi:ABC-type dipeptide/oligopeptide/nickel transport system ATPase component
MSKDNMELASAINLSQISQHPSEAIAALIKVVDQMEEQIALLQENQEIQATLLARLKNKVEPEPQPAQRDRGEILKALIAANSGKMFARDARQQMRLPKNLFSMLLKSQADSIKVRPFHLDHRRLVLELI